MQIMGTDPESQKLKHKRLYPHSYGVALGTHGVGYSMMNGLPRDSREDLTPDFRP